MATLSRYARSNRTLLVVCLCLGWSLAVWSQSVSPDKAAGKPEPEPPKDVLGRGTPRGAVLGFITAAKKDNMEIATLFLNTPLRGEDARVLARQLGAVLDQRLPARLNQISDKPEGSIPDPLHPDEDVVGTIKTAAGDLDIIVERVDRGKLGKVWLFSRKTLDSIPKVFQELDTPWAEKFLPKFVHDTRVAGVPLFQWLFLFIGMPLLYVLTGLLNRALSWSVGALRRRLKHDEMLENPQVLRVPLRLLLVALTIFLLGTSLRMPLLARQFWSTVALFITLTACIWWILLMNRAVETYLLKRRPNLSGSASVLRLFRRTVDVLLLFAGFLFVLYHFGVNLTAALAGLGVGGIAVALAAQKTLENVIGGVSLIADQAVRVGDFLNLGDVQGTVEDVGLRSTRIRTLDRTLVSLPNGQIAGMRLETLSVRDKCWFHPIIGLRYDTSPSQLHSILDELRKFLAAHPRVDPASVRVRWIRFGAYSFDVEMFAYVFARDWSIFLEIQEELLFGVIEIIHNAGTNLAFPSQSLYVTDSMPNNMLHRVAHAGSSQDESEGKSAGVRQLLPRAL